MKKIIRININDSLFFEDGLEINFSEKLNCLMGGRGTGKTTLLYFMMTSLLPESENETIPFSILKNNLGDGKIEVEFETSNGRIFKSIKNFGEDPQFYELPENKLIEFEQIKPELGCDIYEAMAIEEIGRNGENRLNIIDKMLPDEVIIYQADINELNIDLRNNAKDVKTILERIRIKSSEFESIKHIKKEFSDYKKSKPKNIDKEEESKFQEEDRNEKRRSRETRLIKKIINQLETIEERTNDLLEENKEFIDSNINIEQEYQNEKIIGACIKEFIAVHVKLEKQCEEINELISLNKSNIEKRNEVLKKKHTEQKEIFNKLKGLSSNNNSILFK